MRPAAALAVLSCLLVVSAGCGGSDGGSTATATQPGGGETLEQLWREPGDDVAVIAGTQTHEPGNVRVSFLVANSEEQLVNLPTARVWVSNGLGDAPFLETQAKLERIGVPGESTANASHIYVASLKLPAAGKYWMLAEPEGGRDKVQALGNIVVSKSDPVPSVGDPAPASDTPTIASTGGDLSKLTTRTPPDESLLQYSVAGSLKAKVPFVVTFATPKFCESRTCGPVVDVVEEVQKRLDHDGVRFIHVEVYKDNDPAEGYNRWVKEWKLPTEPWTFLVDRNGRIADRFEGAVSADELEHAVREKLVAPQ